jgi:hypothetical protein
MKLTKTIEIRVERIISGTCAKVFDGWLEEVCISGSYAGTFPEAS